MTAIWTVHEPPFPKANLPEMRFATDEELEDVEALGALEATFLGLDTVEDSGVPLARGYDADHSTS